MKKQIISEISRVRQIMGLREQYSETIKTGEEKNVVVVYVPPIEGTYSPNSSDPSQFIDESVRIIMDAINNKEDAYVRLQEGKLKLVDINVQAGASNVWDPKDGATNYDVDNNYKPTSEGNSPELDEGGYERNIALAKERANKYIELVIPLLKGVNIHIDEQISKTPEAVVVNTGGKLDNDRLRSEFPNPGQVLRLTLSFTYTDVQEFYEERCSPGIEITIGSKGKADGHVCDEAVFKVLVNGVKIGVANLNNAGYDTEAGGGAYFWIDKYHRAKVRKIKTRWAEGRMTDGQKGGARSWTTMIDTKNPELNWGEENKLSIQSIVKTENGRSTIGGGIVCDDQGPIGRAADGQPCGSHSEVPYVTIKNTPVTKGELVTVYDNYPNVNVPRGSMKITELLTLNDCGVPLGDVTLTQN